MRVITGKYRGRKIKAPKCSKTRPTLQRAKETMFNMMPHRLKLDLGLDIFCGSGQLGIEALSRGLNKCIFNDFGFEQNVVVKANLSLLDKKDYIIEKLDYMDLLKKYKNSSFDIIFLDPPYPIASEAIQNILDFIDNNNMLCDGGIITGEIPTKDSLKNNYKNMRLKKEKRFSSLTTIFQYWSYHE